MDSIVKGAYAVLSQTSEYALRAVVHLAYALPNASTTDEIAESTKVPRAYLAKVLQALVRNGIVHSQRGVRGGVTLAKPAETLTILEVVNAVDPIVRIRTCPLGIETHGIKLCPLHFRLDQAIASVEQAFQSTTLAEVLAEPSQSVPLCEFPSIRNTILSAQTSKTTESSSKTVKTKPASNSRGSGISNSPTGSISRKQASSNKKSAEPSTVKKAQKKR